MSDDPKPFIAAGTYSMVILLYAWWAIFMAAFYDAFPWNWELIIYFIELSILEFNMYLYFFSNLMINTNINLWLFTPNKFHY